MFKETSYCKPILVGVIDFIYPIVSIVAAAARTSD